MANKFDGELKWIDPSFLITKKEFNRIESFFLGMGVVFNDLKGLELFQKMLINSYVQPTENELTAHAGNYGGILVQTQKLIAGTINEFFIFLKKNTEIFSTTEFKEITNRLAKPDKELWNSMIAASRGQFPNLSDMFKAIAQVRSNVTFHYDHSGKVLRNAYISRFFGNTTNGRNKYAYFSIGDSAETTRFYFADAAVEESLYIAAGKKPGDNSSEKEPVKKYYDQIGETVHVVNGVISSMLKIYIQSRRNKPHK